jgi:predicted helicase
MSIYSILDSIRQTATSERDKGDRFERLMLSYFRTDPTYVAQFKQVWLWSDWKGNKGRPDTGIDLVAENSDGEGFTAIQCKMYAPTTTLDKNDIDSFFNESGKAPFTHRIIVSTTNLWSIHAENSLKGQDKPVRRIGVEALANSSIDWDAYNPERVENLKIFAAKKRMEHQKEAIAKVLDGFKTVDRGKLIMACGTGKTFTAQCIAEDMVGVGKSVLVLVPSISLLSQTVKEWTSDSNLPLNVFAVCSDSKAGRRRESEDAAPYDLALPATTNVENLVQKIKSTSDKSKMNVILSTYQSIGIISEAQKKGVGEFDLIISDEAHRTTGVTLVGEEDSMFTKVHDNTYLKAKKRLYMTATPRMYGEVAKAKAATVEASLASMDDISIFGEEFHRLEFYEAVQRGLLTDYKVIVLAVNEDAVAEAFQRQLSDSNHELKLDDATRIVGCLNAFSKIDPSGRYFANDLMPMKRIVAFSNTISNSKKFKELFTEVSSRFSSYTGSDAALNVQVDHVDGSYNSLKREELLGWLKQEPADSYCSVLSNAKCLTEGVDVPALDGIVFLEPRNSVVDVVQAVGRVMRRNTNKQYGYVILPIGIPSGMTPEEALSDNKRFAAVWQVLNALRSHDKRIEATVNKIDLNNETPEMIEVIPVGFADSESPTNTDETKEEKPRALQLEFPLEEIRSAIYAKMVEKVGTRQYWETWASDVAEIAERHVQQINTLLEKPSSKVTKAFNSFLKGLRGNINEGITKQDAVEMLAQHLITKPIFEAIFGASGFAELNPVSQVMQETIELLEDRLVDSDRKTLQTFYEDVSQRVDGIDNLSGKQKVITELYEKFFKIAFRRTTEKLGIVYTPTEVVDFIIESVAEIVKKEFGVGLSDKNVHIFDPFTGTGTFIARLLESSTIDRESLAYKYENEIHANEIVLLAYYIAAINIESTFQIMSKQKQYKPFEGIVLTDTFQMYEENDVLDTEVFRSNNARVEKLRALPIKVIIGNPPYSVGQNSQNDNNQNMNYPKLDSEIAATYARTSKSSSSKQVFDSYIRAFKWATQRVGDSGIVAFVTNGSYIEAKSMDGFRHHLGKDFHKIYVFNLRGNARTSGELRRKEGGNVFGEGTRTPIAITILVKNPKLTKNEIHYAEVPDYLDRDAKLKMIKDFGKSSSVKYRKIVSDVNYDWLNQVNEDLLNYDAMGEKKAPTGNEIFVEFSNGMISARDSWNFNFSKQELTKNIEKLSKTYNRYVKEFKEKSGKSNPTRKQIEAYIQEHSDSKEISWDSTLLRDFEKGKQIDFDKENIRIALYRPFTKKFVYFESQLNRALYSMPKYFPNTDAANLAITLNINPLRPFGVLMTDQIPDYHLAGDTQVFPLLVWPEAKAQESLFDDSSKSTEPISNISDYALKRYQNYFGPKVTREDIFYYVYGLLHSREYLDKFQTELTKLLPRIPVLKDFYTFSKAGRSLADLHLNYEEVEQFKFSNNKDFESNGDLVVKRIRYAKKGSETDYSTLIINDSLHLKGVPPEAQEYKLFGRSAIEWMIDRYEIKADPSSGIVQDPNKWSDKSGYVLDTLSRVIQVSISTQEIVNSLPALVEVEET